MANVNPIPPRAASAQPLAASLAQPLAASFAQTMRPLRPRASVAVAVAVTSAKQITLDEMGILATMTKRFNIIS